MGAAGSVPQDCTHSDDLRFAVPAEAPPQPPISLDKLGALAADAGSAFVAGLQQFAKQERERWLQECNRLQEHSQILLELRRELEEERQLFEEEKRRFARSNASDKMLDVVALDVGGVERLSVSRDALMQCKGSLLAAAFSGRWTLPEDGEGRIFVDYSPDIFLPLVEYLRARHAEELGGPCAVPPPPFADPQKDERFLDMLRHYRLLDWVYRQKPVQQYVIIGEYQYSVLPQQAPDASEVMTDMRGQEVAVPRGWEILDSSATHVEFVIRELTRHTWGAGLLLLCDAAASMEADPASDAMGSFTGYRTRLSNTGTVGSRFLDPPKWFSVVDKPLRTFTFAGSSYRVVIRAKVRVGAGAADAVARSVAATSDATVC